MFFPEPKMFFPELRLSQRPAGRRPAGRRRPGGAFAGQEIGGMAAESTVSSG